jgi:aryl-alcohol dehydrogenase-like predicted oxidoreductase
LVSNGPDGLPGISHVPIPGTRKPSRVEENAGGAAIVLDDREIGALNQLAQAVRGDRGRQI